VGGAGGLGGAGGYARGTRPVARGAGSGRALPSGAVIGETVGGGRGGAAGGVGGAGAVGRGQAGGAGRGAGARGTTKPKPPSWLPEDEENGGRAGRAASNTTGMSGTGRRSGRRDDEYDQPFDPDNPWAVAEGVEPVILPSDHNPRHDPGPNVIGWHG
jgi:hypothetical protein